MPGLPWRSPGACIQEQWRISSRSSRTCGTADDQGSRCAPSATSAGKTRRFVGIDGESESAVSSSKSARCCDFSRVQGSLSQAQGRCATRLRYAPTRAVEGSPLSRFLAKTPSSAAGDVPASCSVLLTVPFLVPPGRPRARQHAAPLCLATAPIRALPRSTRVVGSGTAAGLAVTTIDGDHYQTYILLANPNTTPAEVQVRFLKAGQAPIVRSYTLKPTSRLNIGTDITSALLGDGVFSADVQVLNYQPIVVEKALYWNSGSEICAAGTGTVGTPIPPEED